ncbi:MAG: protein translocase subunit SecF [Trichodesmium sp. MAG_R04]|nr:protein translocase subunit SecF [Trichodesmium sp. MAG_R04]
MKISVIKHRSLWWTISGSIILSGLIAMTISWSRPDIGAPLRPSLDFVGGTRLKLELDCTIANNCNEIIKVAAVRKITSNEGFSNSKIQVVGEKKQAIDIRTKTLDVDARTQLITALSTEFGKFDPNSTQIDTVGPTLGKQIFTSGLSALLVAFFGITVYLTFRFQFDYAVFAFVALFHDILVTVGIFSILGLVAGVEVDSLFLVALLTIIGFSVNDTVVIYDRVREVIKRYPGKSIDQIVDDAVNQTLTRSINTTVTTLLPLIGILIFGGETLKYLALALIIGFVVGSYSSVFIASTLLAWWRECIGEFIPNPSQENLQSVEGQGNTV